MQTNVTKRGQTVIPADIRKQHGIDEGDTLMWLQDSNGIRVVPVPKDPISALRGRGKGENLRASLLDERRKDRLRE